jgi:hypothetical protein
MDIYELLPRNQRVRLEDAALGKLSLSSVLSPDGPDDTSFVASVAIATAEWDTVIHQAWRLNIEAMDHYRALTLTLYETLTSTFRDKTMPVIDKRDMFLDSRRRLQLDTKLAATTLINDGLYKAPECLELDSLLTKEIRKVCLL